MTAPEDRPVPALPVGTPLLHIGIPKTGTTTLQRTAAYHREKLLENGVCYPGSTLNHREAVSALMSRSLGWKNSESTPAKAIWKRIEREVKQTPAERSLISHEFACESTDEQARRFIRALGPKTHVVITLRGFADLLGSSWQQYVKAGFQKPYGVWLKQILGPRSKLRTTPTFYLRNDQAAIVERWVRVAGVDRVTVVIADKTKPDQLMNAFEDLLDLPRGMLTALPIGGYGGNRGLSAAEAELVLRVNKVFREQGMTWDRYSSLMRHGFIARMQENRRPGPDEPSLALPAWAAKKALAQARRYADAIDATGCRVIGDLSALTAPVRTVPRVERPTQVPIDAAFEAISGLLSAADGRGGFFDEPPEGVQGSVNFKKPYMQRLYDSESGRDVANAIRATRHLDDRTMAAVAAYRGLMSADDRSKPYRNRARKLVNKARRRVGKAFK
ncbi:hypothetical protein [Microlunatus soli]|uniref:Sulfotransferase family protein n=1 Tax=Microlunatus soli TaxID=630515 RepID=A0A1H1PUY3_9ACTN|nr:hypothetical protein [Microlunatus soli]SDS15121.1 hypothetical protein SAMN04489812_1037 [Microlunatus soli]